MQFFINKNLVQDKIISIFGLKLSKLQRRSDHIPKYFQKSPPTHKKQETYFSHIIKYQAWFSTEINYGEAQVILIAFWLGCSRTVNFTILKACVEIMQWLQDI